MYKRQTTHVCYSDDDDDQHRRRHIGGIANVLHSLARETLFKPIKINRFPADAYRTTRSRCACEWPQLKQRSLWPYCTHDTFSKHGEHPRFGCIFDERSHTIRVQAFISPRSSFYRGACRSTQPNATVGGFRCSSSAVATIVYGEMTQITFSSPRNNSP